MDSHRRHRSDDAHRKELRRLRNKHEVELRQRDMQVARHALEVAQMAEVQAQQAEKIDELNRLLEASHIEDRAAIRNYFYGGENASSSSTGQVNEDESLPLTVRFGKVADKLMEFSMSSSVMPELPGGSRSSMNAFVEDNLKMLNTGSSEELMELPGIGPTRATYIRELQQASTEPFISFDDLSKIGLSEPEITRIKQKLGAKYGEQCL